MSDQRQESRYRFFALRVAPKISLLQQLTNESLMPDPPLIEFAAGSPRRQTDTAIVTQFQNR